MAHHKRKSLSTKIAIYWDRIQTYIIQLFRQFLPNCVSYNPRSLICTNNYSIAIICQACNQCKNRLSNECFKV